MTLTIWLWIPQVLLAGLYGMAGSMKSFAPLSRMTDKMSWVIDMPRMTRFIGISELAGALGMILPMVTGTLPGLTPLAAIGFSIIQILAIVFHARRSEWSTIPVNVLLLALSLFVAWGRWDLLVA